MNQSDAFFIVGRDFMWAIIFIFIPICWQSQIVDNSQKHGNVAMSFNFMLYGIALNVLAFYLGVKAS